MSTEFKLEILEPGKTDVFLDGTPDVITWPIVEELDRTGIRVVGDFSDTDFNDTRCRRILHGCSGLLSARENVPSSVDAIPPIRYHLDTSHSDIKQFRLAVLDFKDRLRPYCFFIGRLERDFRHAREAIRVAVEAEAGIPCLWIDDGRHVTNIEGIRERTRLLIKNATFVIADLTLGIENPDRENPSRAHEIGMAIAFDRPLMLCSQEPRRYPYFSIVDMQMGFWLTEDELEVMVRNWIALNRNLVGCRIFNYQLSNATIAKPVFAYNPNLRYIGPKTKRERVGVLRRLMSLGTKRI